MKKIDLLRALQVIDTELDQVRRELEECRSRLGDDSELVPLRETAEATRRELLELQRKGREIDAEIDSRRTKLKADEKKLYDGSIRNPKELGSLSQEVDMEKGQVSKLEDESLAIMDAAESSASRESEAATTLATRDAEWKAEQADLESRCAVLSGRESDLTSRRQEAARPIDAATLRSYESVRRMRGGLAVAAIERGACQGCRISLSSAVVQRARAGADLVPCQSCGRFLFAP